MTSYVEEVRKLWGKSVEDVLKVAKLCAEAVKVLNQGELRSFKNGLPFKKSKLSKLVKVGSDRRLPAITEILPAGYTILYEIACLSDPVFDRAIEEGVIHPDLQKGEIEKWRLKEAREDRPKRFASIFQLTETSETKKTGVPKCAKQARERISRISDQDLVGSFETQQTDAARANDASRSCRNKKRTKKIGPDQRAITMLSVHGGPTRFGK